MQEYKTQKAILDLEYKDEIKKRREEKDSIFEQRKIEINNNVQEELKIIQDAYYKNENNMIESILSSIKNGEN